MPIAAILQLIAVIEPTLPGLIADFRALIAKHPALADPAAQLAFLSALMQAAASVDDATVAKWAADKAAHGG